jgi:hypothetical protein
MAFPECTSYSSYIIDIYILIVAFVLVFVGSFLCCCLEKCRDSPAVESPSAKNKSDVLPTRGDGDSSRSGTAVIPEAPSSTVDYFCGDELYCSGTHKPCRAPRRKACAVSIVVRVVLAGVAAVLIAWVVLAIIFAALQESLMYPAETAAACTPCAGDLATISFSNMSTVPADRSPYCCDFEPTGYLQVRGAFERCPQGVFDGGLVSTVCTTETDYLLTGQLLTATASVATGVGLSRAVGVAGGGGDDHLVGGAGTDGGTSSRLQLPVRMRNMFWQWQSGFVTTSAGDSVNYWFIPGSASYGESGRGGLC